MQPALPRRPRNVCKNGDLGRRNVCASFHNCWHPGCSPEPWGRSCPAAYDRPRPARTFQRLLEDLEAEKGASAGYLQGVGMARRAGAEKLEALRRRIRSEEERHRRELVDILERIDPNA